MPGAQITIEAEHNDSDADRLVNDTLRTKLIQSVHNLTVYGHPGRDATGSILARDFYWPLQSKHVRQFLRNCDYCGRNKV